MAISKTIFFKAAKSKIIPHIIISPNNSRNYNINNENVEVHHSDHWVWLVYTPFLFITIMAILVIMVQPKIIFKKWLPKLLPSRPLDPEAAPTPAPAPAVEATLAPTSAVEAAPTPDQDVQVHGDIVEEVEG
jgi:hypothetical protein